MFILEIIVEFYFCISLKTIKKIIILLSNTRIRFINIQNDMYDLFKIIFVEKLVFNSDIIANI